MTIKRVQQAAVVRGLYFDGRKIFRNSMVGVAYEIYTPTGFFQADTLDGIYKKVMSISK